jgi:hypothetical protein
MPGVVQTAWESKTVELWMVETSKDVAGDGTHRGVKGTGLGKLKRGDVIGQAIEGASRARLQQRRQELDRAVQGSKVRLKV